MFHAGLYDLIKRAVEAHERLARAIERPAAVAEKLAATQPSSEEPKP